MQRITFTAKPVREKPFPTSSEDVNIYNVAYQPPRGVLHGSGSSCLRSLLVESITGLAVANPQKESIEVNLEGEFPGTYGADIRQMFDLYAKAEGVKVNYR